MLNRGVVDRILWMGMLCPVTWCVAISDRHAPRHWVQHTHLRQRIIEAVELITPHMPINTWQELEYRLDICGATTGADIEVYGRAHKNLFELLCTLLKT